MKIEYANLEASGQNQNVTDFYKKLYAMLLRNYSK